MRKWIVVAALSVMIIGCFRLEVIRCDLDRTIYYNDWFCVERTDTNQQ